LGVEATNVSGQGFWLFLYSRELFIPSEHFPWFRNASIGQLLRVERPSTHHLYWPELDIDLAIESISNPERYPPVSRIPASSAREQLASTTKRRRGARGR
jgi:hypothetical protein